MPIPSLFQRIIRRYRELGLVVVDLIRAPAAPAHVRRCLAKLWVPELGEWYGCHDGNENPSGLIGGADFHYGMKLLGAQEAKEHAGAFQAWTGRRSFWPLMSGGEGSGLFLECPGSGPRRVWALSMANATWSCAYDALDTMLATIAAAANGLVRADEDGLLDLDFVEFDALRRQMNPMSEQLPVEDPKIS